MGDRGTPMGTELDESKSIKRWRNLCMRKPRELKDGVLYHITGRGNTTGSLVLTVGLGIPLTYRI